MLCVRRDDFFIVDEKNVTNVIVEIRVRNIVTEIQVNQNAGLCYLFLFF